MMHDVYACTERERQIERATHHAIQQPEEVLDLTKSLIQMHCKSSRLKVTPVADFEVPHDRGDVNQQADTSSMSKQKHGEKTHQKHMQGTDTGIALGKMIPLSPKTRMIEMMEEEREEQQRALDQIEDCYKETRPWLVKSVGTYSRLPL
jgi:hypothetical protein